jgi:hypothetical protein
LIELHKPKIKPAWMNQAEYDKAPDTLKVRAVFVNIVVASTYAA